MKPFREFHIDEILRLSAEGPKLPLDVFMGQYLRSHKAIGSKDRLYISESVYTYVRWKGLIQALGLGREEVGSVEQLLLRAKEMPDLPEHVRVSFPQDLYALMVESLGTEQARAVALASNERAPTTLRVNTLKVSREDLMARWQGRLAMKPTQGSPWGIQVLERANFFAMDEYKQGLFEIQDEGSQLLAQMCQVKPGMKVLDYCAGAGGKSLALAPMMEGRGQLYLHDIRTRALEEARKRLKRAGVQNVQFGIKPGLKGVMDRVLVDAPCSGSGTLRRNPDLKWRFDGGRFPGLLEEQRQIFAEALTYLKPGGEILYGTCSVLTPENRGQAQWFAERHGLKVLEEFASFPAPGEMDGFYGVRLIYKQ